MFRVETYILKEVYTNRFLKKRDSILRLLLVCEENDDNYRAVRPNACK